MDQEKGKSIDVKETFFGILAIILIIFFAISLTPRSLQNDTFYTVTIGKLITENGIDMQDHFSWHELPYQYPHWLYDVGMYFIYNLGSWQGIYISTCVLASILGICTYLTNSRLSKNKILSFIVTLLVLYLIKSYIAARAQLSTFILFVLLVYNIERFLENRKIKNAITILGIHILIANLHVAAWPFTFILYLPYIAEYLVAEIIELVLYRKVRVFIAKKRISKLNKKIEKNSTEKLQNKLNKENEKLNLINEKTTKIKEIREHKEPYKVKIAKNKNARWLIVILIIAIFTGLLTPLGSVPYTYTYNTMIGNTMQNINEHLPLTLINNTPMVCTIVVILILLIFSDVKIKLSDLLMIGGLAFMMFSSRRQQSMFVLIGSIAFVRIVTDFIKMHSEHSIKEINQKLINKFTAFVLAVIVILLSLHFYDKVKRDQFVDIKTYPVAASEWILENLDVNKIKLYNEYNYGSYLLYKGIPVFIDSRADLYAPEFNSPTRNKSDGKDIFTDFINASNISRYYGEVFKEYGITHVMVYKKSKINMLIRKTDSEKYKEIYSDNHFIIYKVLKY